jgi:hypothetical protein
MVGQGKAPSDYTALTTLIVADTRLLGQAAYLPGFGPAQAKVPETNNAIGGGDDPGRS